MRLNLAKIAAHKKFRVLANAAFLIASFGIGQGSIFFVQTWLVSTGRLTVLAEFGTIFSFLILSILIVEAGSITVLAQRTATIGPKETDTADVWKMYWETCIFRLILATINIILLTSYIYFFDIEGFPVNYILFSLPGLVFWAFNAAGILDGRKLSGVSGLTGAIGYVFTALALLFSVSLPSGAAGIVTGSAFSIGYGVTVAAQIITLQIVGFPIRKSPITRKGIAVAAQNGLKMLSGVLPGQVFFRVQIVLCSMMLGPHSTALFLYAKQIAAAASQIVGFLRRVEFPHLVAELGASTRRTETMFRLQKLGNMVSVTAAVLLLIGGVVGYYFLRENLAEASYVVALFSFGIFSGAIYQTFCQGAYALGSYGTVAMITNASLLFGLVTSAALPMIIGLPGFAASEVIMHSIGSIVFYRIFRSTPAQK